MKPQPPVIMHRWRCAGTLSALGSVEPYEAPWDEAPASLPPFAEFFFFLTQLGTARNLRDLLGDACREVADGGDDAVAVGVAQPPSDREADDLIGEHVEVWEESRVLRDA